MDTRLEECLHGQEGSYVLPFFWQHGEDHAVLREEIDAMQRSHIREFCVESRIHPHFCEDEWWADFGFILEEARRRDMRVWLLDDRQFPTGFANGLIMKGRDDLRQKNIREIHMDAAGPLPNASVMAERFNPAEEQLVGVYAYRLAGRGDRLEGEPLVLTDRIRGGMVEWDIPDGVWRLFFVLRTPRCPDSRKNHLHMISPQAGRAMLEAVYEPHYAHFHAYFGNTFAGFFSDEPGFNSSTSGYYDTVGKPGLILPWGDDLTGMLARSLGCDARELEAMLPALWFAHDGCSARLRQAYMDTITRLYSERFAFVLGDWCRAHGVEYIGHVVEDMNAHMRLGVGPGHYFRALDAQDMAGIDVVLHQLLPGMTDMPHTAWVPGTDPEFFAYALARLGASHAHLQPRKKGRALCEIYGAFGWAEGLPMMKWMTDHMLVNGINRFVPHAFSPKYPDADCPPHFYAQGRHPQFPLFGRLMQYTQRMCHLLTGGEPMLSAAVLYNAEAEWCGGDKMLFQKVLKALTRRQLNADVVPADMLETAAVENGRLVINRIPFSTLIVPYSEILPQALLESLAAVAKAGCPVVFADGLCRTTAEGSDARHFDPAFTVVPLDGLADWIQVHGWADITAQRPCPYLRFYHLRRGENDVFLFFNEQSTPIDTVLTLPVTGAGVCYDAFDNTAAAVYAPEDGMPLRLEAFGVRAFVFGPDNTAQEAVQPRGSVKSCTWRYTISLQDAGGEAWRLLAADSSLFDVTSSRGEPRFSGAIRYETAFEAADTGMPVWLDLGQVGETAEVALNGVPCGVRIQAPYRFRLDGLRTGTNHLVIEVRNNPGHRERDAFSAFLAMPPSGVLGPVQWIE